MDPAVSPEPVAHSNEVKLSVPRAVDLSKQCLDPTDDAPSTEPEPPNSMVDHSGGQQCMVLNPKAT